MLGALTPVGPGDLEMERWHALVASLRAHERVDHLVVVDDGNAPRQFPGATVVLRTALPKGRYDAYSSMAAGTLTGLAALADLGVDVAVKLDTDAFVIGPFAQPLADVFGADRTLGMVGRHRTSIYGERTRDFRVHRTAISAAWIPIPVSAYKRAGSVRPYVRGVRAQARVTGLITSATLRGAELGESCLGGAYALSGSALRHAAQRGYLAHPLDWTATHISEDVVVAMLVRACGFGLADDPRFAVTFKGLPAPPQELLAGGFAFVHSLKAESVAAERELRHALSS